jgi:Asp/Glu/hydantoin racemase
MGEATQSGKGLVSVPVFNIDEPMAKEAVQRGGKLGILATVPTSAPATERLLQATADESSRKIEIHKVINEEAFRHLLAGNVDRHNGLVHEEMDKLAESVDAIVLGQISLAQIQHETKVPVLQVGHSGFAEARRLLGLAGPTAG